MKGNKNAKMWVVWGGGVTVTQGHQQHSHSIEHTTFYSTLVETMHLSCIV